MTLRTTIFTAIAAATLVAAPTLVQADVEAGGLVCHSAGGVGYGVASVLNLDCEFTPSVGGPAHRYVGTIHRYGLDLGVTRNVALGWVVLAPTGAISPGDLAGQYGGVQGNASVGVGVGANALVGGSSNSFTLQPVSAEGQYGFNVSAGVTDLELHLVRPAPRHRRHYR
ncbi:MAG: DUF992 domain-containing protein [Bradyrhizobiaceae bacterium]|nr:DUF992 domain-containing protein [Bradyrhizobiaceae bacterium]